MEYPGDAPLNLITGITGQDGILLSQLLSKRNEKVVGLVTRNSDRTRIEFLKESVPELSLIEVEDFKVKSFEQIFLKLKPRRIFNFAALSSVSKSFENPQLTYEVNFELFENLLIAATSKLNQDVRIFQSSSSEMFGNSTLDFQDEKTPFDPISPYGLSKVQAHLLAREYRSSGLYVTSGILFNHESEFRKKGFLTEKIATHMARRSLGLSENLEIGTLDISRDWGYAGDFVKGIAKSLDADNADEFVFATGTQRTILEMIEKSLEVIGDKTSISDFVRVNHNLSRTAEKFTSKGNYQKAQNMLGWQPETSFSQMLNIIIEAKKKQILSETSPGKL